ncbi:Mitotic spindle assembly checkpoint protein MAD2A [Trichuris trichiura]|uniref:Mitotic spindle assembly checkpoint protein MAD2A n=1 Tax=Trichuris trichiura TaxID=36087 RepID=A0A077ZEG5_TRITR|nr:Mitotic spindle assembly checkpoint protein MAD2A [Trichuris trichiura]
MDISLCRSSNVVNIDFINDQSADFAINTIVYQRQLYPAHVFTRVVRFGLPLMVNTTDSFEHFLNRVVDAFQVTVFRRGNWEKQVQRVFHSISAVACFLKPLPPFCECDVEFYIPPGSSVPDDCEVINPMFPKSSKDHNLPSANVGPADFRIHVITEF